MSDSCCPVTWVCVKETRTAVPTESLHPRQPAGTHHVYCSRVLHSRFQTCCPAPAARFSCPAAHIHAAVPAAACAHWHPVPDRLRDRSAIAEYVERPC